MIEPIRISGREMARCTCDKCAAVIEFPAMHGSTNGGELHRGLNFMKLANVARSVTGRGWAISGKRALCHDCIAAARQPKEKPAVTNVEPIRAPTREQKRQIVELLTDVYDTQTERFRGTDSDVTIADAVGGGCMFGWVAEIREAMFGPDGGNEEHTALIADIATWRANADKLADDMHGALREFNDARVKVKALEDRLAKVIHAVGPRGKAIA